VVSRLFGLLILLLAATGAQAQTNPFGAGYSLANGQLYVPTSSSLNSLILPFTLSINVIVPTNTSNAMNAFITSNPSNSGTGGFFVGIDALSANAQTFKLNALIQPSSQVGSNVCTHSGQICWRNSFINDGNRHHVCVRWTPSTSFLYLDSIVRDQTTLTTFSGPFTTATDLFWALGANLPSTATLYDARAYSSDIGSAGCNQLAYYANQGVYPTSGPLSTGMVLHLPMDSTAAPCTNVSTLWTCNDTSGNSNNASNAALAPAVAIRSPPASPPSVSGTISVQATCTVSGTACTMVCYYMDGFLLSGTCPSTSPNYTYSWDTTKAIDGSHVLTAVGYVASGLSGTSAPVTVTVSNGIGAVSYYFDGVDGSDSNNCLAAAQGAGNIGPCQTSTKFNSLTYKGGDTVQFNAATTFTSDSGVPLEVCGTSVAPIAGNNPFGGCTQNFYASSSVFTITEYGSGTCNPLTGSSTTIPTGCARIIANASGSGIRLFNANNVTVENLALTGNFGPLGIGIDATNIPTGASSGVTIQNNYIFEFGAGGGNVITNSAITGLFSNNALGGSITNCLIQDNYITNTGVNGSGVGPTSSSDTGIGTWAATTCTVQGNLVENIGGNNNSQGNGLDTQNWPNPGGSGTRNIFQFNVTHNNGGTFTQAEGGPYSLYSIGGDYTTFQFNEEYNQQCWTAPSGFPACNTSSDGPDNGAADDDAGSTHILHQYNYMHGNIMHGSNAMLFFIGSRAPYGNPRWGDNWYRYNIVENYYSGITLNSSNTSGATIINSYGYYNNTLSSNQSNATAGTLGFTGTCMQTTFTAKNNLCINTATTGYQFYVNQYAPFCTAGMDYNDFYSPTHQDYWVTSNNTLYAATGNLNGAPTNGGMAAWITACTAGTHNLNVNPQIAGTPGTGGTCWPGGTTPPAGPQNAPSAGCPSVYQLQSGSPLINAGEVVSSAPTPDPTVDYYGLTLTGNPPIGASAGP
jgi:hypothetical protein